MKFFFISKVIIFLGILLFLFCSCSNDTNEVYQLTTAERKNSGIHTYDIINVEVISADCSSIAQPGTIQLTEFEFSEDGITILQPQPVQEYPRIDANTYNITDNDEQDDGYLVTLTFSEVGFVWRSFFYSKPCVQIDFLLNP